MLWGSLDQLPRSNGGQGFRTCVVQHGAAGVVTVSFAAAVSLCRLLICWLIRRWRLGPLMTGSCHYLSGIRFPAIGENADAIALPFIVFILDIIPTI